MTDLKMYTRAWTRRQARKILADYPHMNRTELAQRLAPEWRNDKDRYHVIMQHLNDLGRNGELKK